MSRPVRCALAMSILLFSLSAIPLVSGAEETAIADRPLCGSAPDITMPHKEFSVAVWGDPQILFWEEGYDFGRVVRHIDEYKERAERVNPRFRRSVALTNTLDPDFVVTLGDNVDRAGDWEHYRLFVDICKDLEAPLFILMGNHDWLPRTREFRNNPYGPVDYGNFFWTQAALGAPELAQYSFNAGDWHFILFSQPGNRVDNEMERHPEFYAWLEQDLDKNRDRPTIFFTHHPPLPVGRRFFDWYGASAAHRGKLADMLTRHGNVKYAFFGHVHNTVGSIPLISWRYKGTSFIVLPNTGGGARRAYYPETASSSWGTALLKLNGRQCDSITFHTLAGDVIPIEPAHLPEYDDSIYGYLQPEWTWPSGDTIRNGGFEEPLEGSWYVNHLVSYDTGPVQKRLLRTDDPYEGTRYLYLYAQSRKSTSTVLSDVRQAFRPPRDFYWPQITFRYRIRAEDTAGKRKPQPYVIVTGHRPGQSAATFALVYFLGAGRDLPVLRAYYRKARRVVFLKTEPVPDEWTGVALNIQSDCKEYLGYELLGGPEPDVLVVTFGVSNAGIGLDDVRFRNAEKAPPPSPGFKEVDREDI
jgi:hypothetical protein